METAVLPTLVLAVLVSGCGTTDTTQEHVSTPVTKPAEEHDFKALQTYIGGQIFKVDRTRPLPNAFGGADIFGRKVGADYLRIQTD